MIRKLILLVYLFIFSQHNIMSQQFGKGLFLGDKYFVNSPKSAPLMRGDYDDLPKMYSLKDFSPTPGSQGIYGTCTGWSSAYAGRTILEAIRNQWTREEIDENVFSPYYVYNQIKVSDDCYGGASIIDALDLLKNQGDVKMNYFGFDCDREVKSDDIKKASEYKIIEYREIADRYTNNKSSRAKKSLSENKPVVIAIDCPNSFYNAKDLWIPDSGDYRAWSQGHGLTLVGYDDNKYGGAFEIINSWGIHWGNNGYTWMKYSDFQYFCLFAFELIDVRTPKPNVPDLSGTLSFIESSGAQMRVIYENNKFSTEKSYVAGTLFELIISNNEPAYVYAFGSDLTNKTYKIFPFHDKMVAYLPYRQNNVAIPDENSYNMLDATTGTTYYCFLYSKEKLDIDDILKKIEEQNSSFTENLYSVLGNKFIDPKNIKYKYGDKISFKAVSGEKSIVPVIVEIPHD